MPISTGISVVGRQLIGGFNSDLTGWLLITIAPNRPNPDERIGTVLVTQFINSNADPTQSAFKLYGSGVYWPNYPFTNVPNMRLYVIWFRAGIGWQFNRL